MLISNQFRGVTMHIQSYLEKYEIEYYSFDFSLENPIDTLYFLQSPEIDNISELHYHNALEIGFCYSGSGIFIINGEIISFKAPCAAIIYENQLHKAQSNPHESSKWVFISLNPSMLLSDINALKLSLLLKENFHFTSKAGIIHISDDSELVEIIHTIMHEIEVKNDGYLDCIRGLFWSALIKHNRIIQSFDKKEESSSFKINIIMHEIGMTVNYISTNYKNNISIYELVKISNLSEATLRRKFKDALGSSPIDYLHKVRMNTTCALLFNPSLSIIDICYMVGYDSQSCFNRQFKKHFGMSPTQWKNEHM